MPAATFDPSAVQSFRFVDRVLSDDGRIALTYALDDLEFTEEIVVPVPRPVTDAARERVSGLVALLHWVAGVSYFKAAAPPEVSLGDEAPPPATARLLEALYSEGLGEFAYESPLSAVPRPVFPAGPDREAPAREATGLLVCVGGGKDSIVALETARASGRAVTLFSVGDAEPIRRTAEVAQLPRLIARRAISPALLELNGAGALNGHVPVTAIVSSIALITAALNDCGAVVMANERSASSGNLVWDGIEINHQFSKGRRAEQLLAAAVAEVGDGTTIFSLLRPASELAIARAFARLTQYHHVFTSCNAVFRLDPSRRATSWCGDCPKCRFVFLALAPFSEPAHLTEVFGSDLLDEAAQYEGFALLTATGGDKPFECVGEEDESLAAFRLLAQDDRWKDHAVVRRFADEVLPETLIERGDPQQVLALSDDHDVPADLLAELRALLGA